MSCLNCSSIQCISSGALQHQTQGLGAPWVRKRVDQSIAELENQIRVLRTHRNTLADTRSLPPEILSCIFIMLKRMLWDGSEQRLSWLRVTHVCRHWRAVALDCSALWSNIIFVSGNPELMEMMLERSKNSPLTINCVVSDSPALHGALREIVSKTNRLREVELRIGGPPYCPVLELRNILSRFESSAPILEKLVLERPYSSDAVIPQNFLIDGAPSLQHLDISKVEIHWDSLPLSSSMIHLQLSNSRPQTRPTQKPFWESVAKMVGLKTLKLSACLPPPSEESYLWSPTITLPFLRVLELEDDSAEIRQFFCRIQIPRETRVRIKLGDQREEPEVLRPFLSSLRGSLALSGDTAPGTNGSSAKLKIVDLRVVDAELDHRVQIMCRFNDQELPQNFDTESSANLNFIAGSRSTGFMRRNALLTAIAERWDISLLRSLKIAGSRVDPTPELFGLFRNLTKLDEVVIGERYPILSAFLESLQKKNDDSIPFPALQSIELEGIDFDEDRTGDEGNAVNALARALKEWNGSHANLEEFQITECMNFHAGHWEMLRCALPEDVEMYWDEYEDLTGMLESDEDEDDESD